MLCWGLGRGQRRSKAAKNGKVVWAGGEDAAAIHQPGRRRSTVRREGRRQRRTARSGARRGAARSCPPLTSAGPYLPTAVTMATAGSARELRACARGAAGFPPIKDRSFATRTGSGCRRAACSRRSARKCRPAGERRSQVGVPLGGSVFCCRWLGLPRAERGLWPWAGPAALGTGAACPVPPARAASGRLTDPAGRERPACCPRGEGGTEMGKRGRKLD